MSTSEVKDSSPAKAVGANLKRFLHDIGAAATAVLPLKQQQSFDKLEEDPFITPKVTISAAAPAAPPQPPKTVAILEIIQKQIKSIEDVHQHKSGFVLSLSAAVIAAFISTVSNIYIPDLPAIQVLYLSVFFAFIVNFYIVREIEIQPLASDESRGFLAQLSGLFSLAACVTFIYAMIKCGGSTALFSFSSIWVIYALFEPSKHHPRLSLRDAVFALIALGLTLVIAQPEFFPEYVSIFKKSNEEIINDINRLDHIKGVAAASLAGYFFNYSNQCLRQLHNENIVAITHLFLSVQPLLLPVFYFIQRTVQMPCITEWIAVAFFGSLIVFAIQFYIRSTQLDNSAKSLLVVPLFQATHAIFSILLGVSTFGVMNSLKIIAAITFIIVSYIFASNLQVNGNLQGRQYTTNGEQYSNQRQKSQIITELEDFEKNHHSQLNEKLLKHI